MTGQIDNEAPAKSQAGRLKKLAPSHKAMAQWMIANPLAPRSSMAAAFQISQEWCGRIVNSEAFKHYLRELDEGVAEQLIIPLRGRLIGVADLALEKLGLAVEASSDPRFLLDAADKTLHRLGYAPSKGPAAPTIQNVQQNNVYVADADALRRARERIHASAQAAQAQAQIQALNELPAPEEV